MSDEIDLSSLEIDGFERVDNRTMNHHASFRADDGCHVAVFDVSSAESRNAVWVRVFDGDPSDPTVDAEPITNGHISESTYDGLTDIPDFVRTAVIAGRMSELGYSAEQAQAF